jgi:hypothetical protein
MEVEMSYRTRGRRWWRPHRQTNPPPGRSTPQPCTDGGPAMANAMQLAIGLLTASADSPRLQAWALLELVPEDETLGDLLAGLHVVCELLLRDLQAATGQPTAATLQRFALLAESRRGTPLAG